MRGALFHGEETPNDKGSLRKVRTFAREASLVTSYCRAVSVGIASTVELEEPMDYRRILQCARPHGRHSRR